ncbi:MAG TPA: hybrid sensor histidine kinase/response regulator, partial [Sphingorhabdus sp.]|nr:hybrid sensor histidine kinase/response regulator [Sphingorhabdus sp.]
MAGSLPTSQFGKTGREGGEAADADRLHLGIIAASVALSLLLVWIVTGDAMMLAVTAAGLIGLGGFLLVASRIQRPAAKESETAPPDWSVTYSAIELDRAAVAVSDRAGRLLCANGRFNLWFEGLQAPPDLGLGEAERELLLKAGRTAWRDGRAHIDAIAKRGTNYRVEVMRTGAADEFLLWRFAPV